MEFSQLSTPSSPYLPSSSSLPSKSSLVSPGLSKNPSLFYPSSPNLFGTSGKASNFLPSLLPVTQGCDGDSAKSSYCFPQSLYFHPHTGSELRASCSSPCRQSPCILLRYLGNKVTISETSGV